MEIFFIPGGLANDVIGYEPSVLNFTELRAIIDHNDNDVIFVRSPLPPGWFYYDAASVVADDGVDVGKPDDVTGAGRWIRTTCPLGPALTITKARLTITGTIAQGTNFLTTASGPSYTHNGAAISLNTSQALFRSSHNIVIHVNGVEQDKETEILWVNSQTFQLISLPVDAGDIIQLYN
jgi:hypothetical protein